jgi:hypothetical protein
MVLEQKKESCWPWKKRGRVRSAGPNQMSGGRTHAQAIKAQKWKVGGGKTGPTKEGAKRSGVVVGDDREWCGWSVRERRRREEGQRPEKARTGTIKN